MDKSTSKSKYIVILLSTHDTFTTIELSLRKEIFWQRNRDIPLPTPRNLSMCCYCVYPAVKGGHRGTELIGEHRGADTSSCSPQCCGNSHHRSVAAPSNIAEIGGHRNTAVTDGHRDTAVMGGAPQHWSHGWAPQHCCHGWAQQHGGNRWAPQHGGNRWASRKTAIIGGRRNTETDRRKKTKVQQNAKMKIWSARLNFCWSETEACTKSSFALVMILKEKYLSSFYIFTADMIRTFCKENDGFRPRGQREQKTPTVRIRLSYLL